MTQELRVAPGVRRAAVIAYHSSPIAEPGVGDSGGMTIYVREVARALARLGVATDVYTRAPTSGPRVAALYPNVRVISLEAGPLAPVDRDELPRHIDEFANSARAFAVAQRITYDVVHSHYWHSGLIGRVLADAWAAPLVHSHHTLGLVKNRLIDPGDDAEPESRLAGERRVISTADVLVASTDEEWEQLSCLYAAAHDRLKVIHPGVDHDVFHPGDRVAARRRIGLTGGLTVLFAGRIQRLKGLELAIRAVEELVPALDEPLTFVIVGGASGAGGAHELERLEQLVDDLGLRDGVQFRGPQPHAWLPAFYRAADVSLVCSYSESFGLAALEAQACGTPVVATAVGGLAHIIEDGVSGYLVPSRDPTMFAARLKTLLSDSDLRERMSRAAVDRARSFSWQVTANALADLYSCLVRERSPELCTC